MKKILALFLIVVSIFTSLLQASAHVPQMGDINDDGKSDNLDAAKVLKYDAHLTYLDENERYRADVNGDGEVDSLDAAAILKYDVGLISFEEMSPPREDSPVVPEEEGSAISIEGKAFSYADWFDDDDIYSQSVNGAGLYCFDSAEELQGFKAEFGNDGRFDRDYDEVPSFNSVTESYNAAFFAEYSLLLKYISSAGSRRYTVYDLRLEESQNKLVLYYGDVNYTLMETDDLNGFFVTVPVSKTTVQTCTAFESKYARPVSVYTPDETWNYFIAKESLFDGTEKGLVAALEREGGIPEGSVLKYFDIHDGVAYADMNQAFATGVSAGTFTEYFYVGCLVNTLLDNDLYHSYTAVKITVNGQPMVTDHVGVWDEPLGYYSGMGEQEGTAFVYKKNEQALATEEELKQALIVMGDFVDALKANDADAANAMATENYLAMTEAYGTDSAYPANHPVYFRPAAEYAQLFAEYTVPAMLKFSYFEKQDAAITIGNEKHVLFVFAFYHSDEAVDFSYYVFDMVFEGDTCKVNNFGKYY